MSQKSGYSIVILAILLAQVFFTALGGVTPAYAAGSISVDRTDDPAVTASGVGAAACTAAANDCSLRGATLYANTHPGTTINIPAGIYQLTIDGASEGGNCLDETIGDLDIAGNNTVMVGAGAASTIIQQTRPNDRVICVDQNLVGNFNFSISGVTITGGRDTFGICGGGMVSGYPGDVTTVTNVIFSNNLTSGVGSPWGGGLCNGAGALTISGSTFDSNSATGYGGGLYYSNNGTPDTNTLSLNGSTFKNNTSGTNGGGLFVQNTSSAYSVTRNTFTDNTSSGGNAIYNSSGTLNASYNRFVNPAAGSDVYANTGATNSITNNWWGCNGGPGATGCDVVGGGGTNTYNPWIILKTTASPNPIESGEATTLTTSVLQNSIGGVLNTGDVTALVGLPVTWTNAVSGSFSSAQTTIQANGQATSTFTHDGLGCTTASAEAKIDNVQNADGNATANINFTCEMQCGGTGTYTFNTQSGVVIEVTGTGTNLACLRVKETDSDHPNATGVSGGPGTKTGKYWTLSAFQSDKTSLATEDYVLNLTLPHTITPDTNAKVCKYTGGAGSGWDCDRTTSTPGTVTRNGLSSLSDWTVGNLVSPTAVTLRGLTASTSAIELNSVVVFGLLLAFGLGTWWLTPRISRSRHSHPRR